MNLLQTITPKGTRYFINSRRVSLEAYEAAKFMKRLSCFSTQIVGHTTRHYLLAQDY